MRFPIEPGLANGLIACALSVTLAGCSALGGAGGDTSVASPVLATSGPQADYPILVGPPYAVDGVTFTPADMLNYDEVGYIALDAEASGITGAHHTLPVPSYVEVTSLETGRTILARLERRGPMTSTHLIALSPGALTQLGATLNAPVRVRRVNPPEDQRALLRTGEKAGLRKDTPMPLVAVLRRDLVPRGPAAIQPEPEPAPVQAP